ncbi:MAG: hydrogenase maturation protease [Anaerolineae bacterium]|nr:hydrogenase maturation protease [Anaerolineae bacterium]
MKTLVLGLGNPILTDDGVGVRVAEAVRAALPPDSPVEVSEASVGGLRLMERVVGYDRVILIDAWHHPLENQAGQHPATNLGRNAGAIHRLTLDDLRHLSPTQHSASAHDTSLITALAMAERMGLAVPQEFIIYAVEVENIIDFGEEPTPAVAAAVPKVTAAVLEELALRE